MNAQHNNTNTYSTAELLRYLDGRMERWEGRALERAMLDDEMLADSVEGYRLMRETVSDEVILAKAFNISGVAEKKEEKKITPVVPVKRFGWLGYAIAASLVVAAGWWIFSTTQPDAIFSAETNELTNPAYVSADPVDTIINTEKQPAMAESPSIATTEQSSKEIEKERAGVKKAPPQTNEVAKLTEIKPDLQPVAPTVVPEDAIAGKIERPVISDAESRMRMQRIAPEVVSSERPTLTFSLMDSTIAIPVIGWNSYREYLAKSLDLPHFEKPSVITVSLNMAGKITGVSVEAPVGDKEKASIIQTIQTGPPWKNKSGKPAKATIQFQ